MDRWLNRVAVVTGASVGIGAACCKDLLAKGMIVVGLDRREHLLHQLKTSLPADQALRFYPLKCDISDEQKVIEAFAWIEKDLGGADVLINNAAIFRKIFLINMDNSTDIRDSVETNLLGTTWCVREIFLSLNRRKVNDGHVIMINSICGHKVMALPNISLNIYAPTKHAMTAMTEVLRQEFIRKGTNIKVSSISPGFVDTEMIDDNVKRNVGDIPMLLSEDVADAVTYCIQTPPNVQIHELIIKPIGEKV